MRGFVLVLIVAMANAGLDVNHPDMEKNAKECAEENKVDLSVFKPGEMPDPKIFENAAYKCWMKCVTLKAGFCSASGEPNIDKMKETFNPPEEALAQIKTCAEENKQEDPCERVYKMYECTMKTMKKD